MEKIDSGFVRLLRKLAARKHSAETVRRARLLVADTLGCIAAGFAAPEVATVARLQAPGAFRWPGAPLDLAAGDAAWTGAVAACWDEGCEGLARAHGRPGLSSIPAALPLVHARGGTLGEAIDAVILGYEVGGRLGEVMRIRPGMHVDGTWTSMAAAAAASKALGHDEARIVAAVDLAACQMPASLYLPITHGATGRNTYLGHAARLGVDCARAVEAGITAPPGAVAEAWKIVLGGAGGELPLADAQVALVEEGYLKPYASVRHAHYGVAAAALLRERLKGRLNDIASIELEVYAEAITYAGNRAPASAIQAQFSLSFGVAAMLVLGDLGPEAYRRMDDPMIRGLERKVVLVKDEARTAASRRGATLRVHLPGDVLEEKADSVAGDPGRPLTHEETRAKFLRYAKHLPDAARLFDAVTAAPAATKLGELLG